MKLLGIFAIAVLLFGFTSYTGHSFAQTDNAKSATSTGSETVPNQAVNPATEKQSEDVEAQKEKAMEKLQAIKDKRKTAFEERKKDLQKVKESGTKEKTSALREKAIAERKITMEKINAIKEKVKAESTIDIKKIKETMEKAVEERNTKNVISDAEMKEMIKKIKDRSFTAQTNKNGKQAFDQNKVIENLSEKAKTKGFAKIIVGLKIDFTDEGKLKTEEEKKVQREKIHDAQQSLLNTLDATKIKNEKRFKYSPYIALTVDKETLDKLVSSSMVKSIHEDIIVKPSLDDSIPLIGADAAHAAGFGGSGKMVAVLDTGVDYTHSFFAGKTIDEACFSTTDPAFSESSLCPFPDPITGDQIGPGSGINCSTTIPGCDHGTHVAGIAVGNGVLVGVAKDADLMAVQVFTRSDDPVSCGGAAPCIYAYFSDILLGLERVYTQSFIYSIASANLSLGGGLFLAPCTPDPAEPIVSLLKGAGIATVAASGNDFFKSGISSPACVPDIISVGSTTTAKAPPPDTVSFFSNSASFLDMLAPGEMITSAAVGGGLVTFMGTSMASPHVAGAFAVMKEKAPAATVDDISTALIGTGVPITDINGIPKPRIQLDKAVAIMDIAALCPDPLGTYTVVSGTPGPDRIAVSVKSLVLGLGGDDYIRGSGFDDCIFGDAGADNIRGGGGMDTIFGGDGADQIGGGPDADMIFGEGEADRIAGDGGSDFLSGGPGDDSIAGRAGDDTLVGDEGIDRLSGGTESDTIAGGDGDDELSGREGDDSLDGGLGIDTCSGGPGSNVVTACEFA